MDEDIPGGGIAIASSAQLLPTDEKPGFLKKLFGRRDSYKSASGGPAISASEAPGGPWQVVSSTHNGFRQSGIASWYGGRWHSRRTANGERYDQSTLTAAHRTLPFNTLVRVTNQRNGRSVVVRINNRGPHIRGRVIDLSVAAARQIGSYSGGLAPVDLEVVGRASR
jgi:rare lipoprotein A